MEGAAVAYVSNLMRVPAIFLKAVSNFVDGETSIHEEFEQNLQATVVVLQKVVAQVVEFINDFFTRIHSTNTYAPSRQCQLLTQAFPTP
ncbi:hypothetical protein L1987_86608 [Smallanthus sonchifolius]|uniref:Uncharacterized protein n=1 Tax=Smallanthus sonchifolius TaxID=185202 RepID=A0ACB8Y0E9_9ASTR|nr:hypothetical protein L1987_86608 [Smallanthus sonchifolius]